MDGIGLCGSTRWKAAKAVSKTMTNLDETGLVEAAMFWNDKKVSNLPKYLKAHLQKVHTRMLPH